MDFTCTGTPNTNLSIQIQQTNVEHHLSFLARKEGKGKEKENGKGKRKGKGKGKTKEKGKGKGTGGRQMTLPHTHEKE